MTGYLPSLVLYNPHPREDSLKLIEYGAGWAPEPIWMFQRKNSLAPVGF